MREPPARRGLVTWLVIATVFEGYDNLLLGLALPAIRADLGMTIRQAGLAGSVIFAGSFGSFLLLLLADRWSRRGIMVFTVVGYTIATVLTAASQGVGDFVAYQFIARVFIGAEIVIASFIVVEGVREDRRGRNLAVLSASETAGQALAGVGFLVVVLAAVSWRWLYAAAGMALVLLIWTSHLPAGRGHRRPVPITGVPKRWIIGASLLGFFFAIFPGAVGMFASTIVLEEWRWSLADLNPGYVAMWAIGLSGFFVAGRLMDVWGRRPTALAFFTSTTVVSLIGFAQKSDLGRAVGLAAVLFFLTGSSATLLALTTEPFRPEVRGRVGAIVRTATVAGTAVAPGVVGLLAGPLGGVGRAVGVISLSFLCAALVIGATLPETRKTPSRSGR